MSRRAPDPAGVLAAREAFLGRHPGFCGTAVPGGETRDPERVAYLDESLRLSIRAYVETALAVTPADLFGHPGAR